MRPRFRNFDGIPGLGGAEEVESVTRPLPVSMMQGAISSKTSVLQVVTIPSIAAVSLAMAGEMYLSLYNNGKSGLAIAHPGS